MKRTMTRMRTATTTTSASTGSTNRRSMLIRKPFAAIAIDEENEVDDTTMNHEDQDNGDGGGARLVIDDDGDDDPLQQHHHVQKQKHAKKCHRRRRRSSARFLNLSYQPHDGDDDNDDDNDDAHDTEGGVGGGGSAGAEKEQLGELYKRAIRMNAENRINAGNSWNIKLIENMDKLTSHDNGETVNFTKASCTLDASVKIYSYRVDDVHLTSYKVLANLNRNDALPNNDKNKGTGNGNGTAPGTGQPNTTNKATNLTSLHHDPDGDDDVDDEQRAHDSSSSGRKANGTLETNLGTLYVVRKLSQSFCVIRHTQTPSETHASHHPSLLFPSNLFLAQTQKPQNDSQH